MQIDWSLLINWFVSGFVGAIFGATLAWIAHGFAIKRDRINWERQSEQIQKQKESESKENERLRIVDQLTKDIHNPQFIKKIKDDFARDNFKLVGKVDSVEAAQIIQILTQYIIQNIKKE